MTRFVSVGECMVELSPTGTEGLWQEGIAGDTLNTAWYARAALPDTWRVDYVTRLGTDHFSDKILTFLASNNLGTNHISRDPVRGPGLYAISLKNGERSFTYWRSDSAARRLADDPALLAQAMEGASLIFVSGITVAILPPSGRLALHEALSLARSNGSQIAFDPNVRPRLWENLDTARDWITRFSTRSTIVLPSFDDEAALFGDATPRETIARCLDAGTEEVVVKNGGGEIFWSHLLQAGSVSDLPTARPLDTTGAGDSFNGAYLAARLQGASVPAAIGQAHQMALRVVMHRGALVAFDALRQPAPDAR